MDTRDKIMQALGEVMDPELHRSLTELKMVDEVQVDGSTANIKIKLTIPGCPMKAKIKSDVVSKVQELPEIESVNVEFSSMNDQERASLQQKVMPVQSKEQPTYDHIKNVIAVCSGKGGVGKSTITANLAVTLSRKGYTVGLLDADVYGFSIPRMMGVNQQKPTAVGDMLIPIERDGVKIISMGFFVPDDGAVVWRGPLLHKAITQFIDDVAWGELDYLLIDLPPGTGDVTISIAQKLTKSKLLIVTTPQISAYNVAARVGAMAEKTNLQVLGVVENMSYFETANGAKEFIFGEGGGKVLADNLKVDLFAQIPLITAIREGADQGAPYSTGEDGSKLFMELVEKLI